ncbi:MAG: hypothetical protein U9R56_05085, partial [candidate division Zixibacteria bacterium]|nr:hypothetical protein [candidate division Zixibacteria bacterium]
DICSSECLTLDGYFKNFSVVYDLPIYTLSPVLCDRPMLGAVSNRLRLNGRYRFCPWLSLTASYDFAPRVQDPLLFESDVIMTNIDAFSYRLKDFDSRLYPSKDDTVGSFALFHNLDRAFFMVRVSQFDLYLGRQAIAWGSARVINPTDIIAPFVYGELDIEDRSGVDAVRVRVPMGFMGEIDAGYVFGDDGHFDNSALYLRGRYYVARTDIAVIIAGFRGNAMVGIDLTRAIGGAGVWLEVAQVFADAMDNSGNVQKDYLRASLGLDYNFRGNIYTFLEYHYNQPGTGDAGSYLENMESIAYSDGTVYLMGEHYITPGVSCQITPLITVSGEALVNLADPSVMLSPTVEYNIAEDIYVAIGAWVGFGRSPHIKIQRSTPSEKQLVLRSEFSGYPDVYFGSFRIYF